MTMKPFWNVRKQIIGVAAIVLLVILMMNINSRLGEYFNLSSQRDVMGTQVANSLATKVELESKVAYATSELSVADWARNEAHQSLPGDKVIIPLTPVAQVIEAKITPTPTPQTVDNWQIWWALFFEK